MKDRQRWTAEEDDILRAYVKQYGAREWHLVSRRLNVPLDRDSKSCLERWKNYLKPGIKKGSLTEEEQRLVIRLQAKHGNKWKKIAAEIPGRTAKRLGKWWEVFKEKQQREKKHGRSSFDPAVEDRKYDQILENFAEKLVKDRSSQNQSSMASGNGGFDSASPYTTALPPWLSSPCSVPSPSVTLSLIPAAAPVHWLQTDRSGDPPPPRRSLNGENRLATELEECCRELEEGHRAIMAQKKEASWRLRRLELQLESEKRSRRREIMEEIQSKIQALIEEQNVRLDRIDAEYREQLGAVRRDAETKEQKLAEQWTTKHSRLSKFIEKIMTCGFRVSD